MIIEVSGKVEKPLTSEYINLPFPEVWSADGPVKLEINDGGPVSQVRLLSQFLVKQVSIEPTPLKPAATQSGESKFSAHGAGMVAQLVLTTPKVVQKLTSFSPQLSRTETT